MARIAADPAPVIRNVCLFDIATELLQCKDKLRAYRCHHIARHQYQALQQREIRLLSLDLGEHSDKLQCILRLWTVLSHMRRFHILGVR